MSPGQTNTRIILDPVVDPLQMITGSAADLQHEIELTRQIIACDDVGILVDMNDERIVEPGVFHADLHEDGDVIAELAVVTDHSIGLDESGLFHFFDTFNDR